MGTSSLNSYARCYVLADEGCSTSRVVTGAGIGIGDVNADVAATVNVYTSTGCLAGAPGTGIEVLLASAPLAITTSMKGTTVEVALNTTGFVVGIHQALLIEYVVQPSQPGLGYFPGATPGVDAARGPSYVKFPECGAPNYIDICEVLGLCLSHNIISLSTTATCDQVCEGETDGTPIMYVTRRGRCFNARVPASAVDGRLSMGWECGICPDE
jgi:hypothetical protein